MLGSVAVQDVDLLAKIVLPRCTGNGTNCDAYVIGRYSGGSTPSYYRIGAVQVSVMPNPSGSTLSHWLYVVDDGEAYVYDIDNNHALVKQFPIPEAGKRGVAVAPKQGLLYISECGLTDCSGSHGSLLAYDLVHDVVAWIANYSFGVDQLAVTPDGSTIYMPHGADSGLGVFSGSCSWTVSNAPSHGISLSPDEKRVYVMDAPLDQLEVYDVSGLPTSAPHFVASIPLASLSGSENPCQTYCEREGWVLNDLSGRYVYVGDTGNVVSTSTLSVVMTLPALQNTRQVVEIDWMNGIPSATSTRFGIGRVTG